MKKTTLLGLFLFAVCLATNNLIAQYDTLHYIPPVYVSDAIKNVSSGCRDHYLILSTNETNSFQVTIERGDGSIFSAYTLIDGTQVSPGVFNLSRTNAVKLQFAGTGVGVENIFSESSLNAVLSVGGYKLTAPKRFFANIRHISGSQAASLTTKGTTALGLNFLVGFQVSGAGVNASIDVQHSNFIAVMATEDNTNVTINNFRPGVTLIGQPASGIPATSNTINFTLNEGESYIVAQTKSNASVSLNEYNGIRVSANKAVAVNSGSWTSASNSGGSRDIGIDQLVPSKFAGVKYGITSGNGETMNTNPIEKVIVVSTRPGTTTVNSGAGGVTVLNGIGDYAILTGSNYWASASSVVSGTQSHFNMALTSTQPILVYQTLFGSSNGATSSMNLLPPLADCIGSDSIYIHDPEQFGSSSIISITSPVTAKVSLWDDANNLLLTIPPSSENFPGTLITDFVTAVYDIPNSVNGVLITSDEKVTVGFLGASGVAGGAGFMSAFSDRNVEYSSTTALFVGNGETKLDLCEENPADISIVDNGVYTSFQWYLDNNLLSGETAETITVSTPGVYYAIADYCSLPLESTLVTVGEFGSPGGQGFSNISGLYEAETFDGFANNSAVGTWDDESKFFNNALSPANVPLIKTTLNEKPGFHPIPFFNASNNEYLKTMTLSSNLNGSNHYSFFVVLKDEGTANTNEVITIGNSPLSPRIIKVTNGYRFEQPVGASGGPIAAEIDVDADAYVILSVVSNGTTVEIFANGKKGPITAANTTSNTLDVTGELVIGGSHEGGASYFQGGIAELVLFDTTMSTNNRQKIETYYAVKYGITLDPIDDEPSLDDGDYISNAGSVVWDYSANASYHNSVAGIAYDACGRLRQWQNRDANNLDFVTLALGDVANTALTNPNSLTTDNSYLLWGHDAGAFDSYGVTDMGITLNGEAILARVARVWKTQETGTVGTVRVQFIPNEYSNI